MAVLSNTSLSGDANLTTYYPLDGNSNDLAGTALNGTDTSITYGASFGKYVQGASFNGTSSKILLGTEPADLRFTGDFSIRAIIKKQADGVLMVIMSNAYNQEAGGGNRNGWSFRINSSNKLEVRLGLDTTSPTITSTNAVVTADGEFHDVCVVRSGNNWKFYIDGVLDSTKSQSGTIRYASSTPQAHIGAEYVTSVKYFFNGYVDDVATFNRALTDAEVLELYEDIALSGGALLYLLT